MRTFLIALLLAALAAAAGAQSINIPVGGVTVTPTPPPFTQAASVTLNQTVTVNGSVYQVTGTLSGTLTFTPSGGTTGTTTGQTTGTTTGSTTGTTGSTTGATTGSTTGGTTGAFSIGAIYNMANQPVTSAPSGSTVTIHGNLPPSSSVTFAGLPATVTGAAFGQITVILPTVTTTTTGPVVVTPPGGPPLTGPPFTITGGVAAPAQGTLGNYMMGAGGWANAAGYWTDNFSPGDIVNIYGWLFGPTPGRVEVGAQDAAILAWEDRRIQIQLPEDLPPNAIVGVNLAISNANGDHYVCMAFTVW